MKRKLLVILLACATVTAMAVEGMFPLNELKNLDQKKLAAMGLHIPLSRIEGTVSKAVVHLGGGSGSFVSHDGLIVTNHHVAYRAIQYNSTAANNYIETGFYAPERKQELPAPGYYAEIIESVTDVTDRVHAVLKPGMSDAERTQAVEDVVKQIEKETESSGAHIRASVAAMYQGRQYLLFKKIRLEDIRLVYAPPASIGEFGGDEDNFEWPRHTGDFSFMRAYVAPDGQPAAYSKDNVPYHPEHFLPISIKPLKKGDFTFILGFPGSTNRYLTAEQMDFYLNDQIPFRLKLFKDIIDILNEVGARSTENKVRVAFWVKALNNSMKYYQGVYDGLKRDRAVETFRKRDTRLTAWIQAHHKTDTYGTLIADINAVNDRTKPIAATLTVMGYTRLIPTFRAAGTIMRWAEEKVKPDLERDPTYMDRNVPRLQRGLKTMQNDLLVESDKRLLTYFLDTMAELPAQRQPATFRKYFGKVPADQVKQAILEKVDAMYAATGLTSLDTRMKYFQMPLKELKKVNDPLLQFGGAFADELKAARDENRAIAGALMRLKPRFIQLVHEATGNELYPDANSTIRMTYGSVMGYSPRDAVWYKPFTTLKGVVEKETGDTPFASPRRLLDLYTAKDFGRYAEPSLNGQVPVNFLTDNDTTGGNSGSPTLNGDGQLIGLLFDGNYESISADYLFNPALTRSIVADSRYMIFILEKFSHATSLLNELTIIDE